MSPFDTILGQAQAVDLLRKMLETKRLPHALLFQGPEGVGKMTTARLFAAALLCEQGSGCGACATCVRVAGGTHPDVIHVGLLPRESSRRDELASVITIRQIRDVARLAGLAPHESQRRLFLVDPADRMNHEAQNALLKTLEEPPGRSQIVLIAARPHVLLPTVRSRCFTLRFSSLRSEELERLLVQRGLDRSEASVRASLAAGRPGAALELDLGERRDRREAILALVEQLLAGKLEDLPAEAARLAGKDEATLLDGLDLLQGLLRDAARSVSEGEPASLLNADLRERLERVGRRIGVVRSAALVAATDRVRSYLRFNTNRLLIAEGLLAAVAGGPIP